jgi:hypothetical protein
LVTLLLGFAVTPAHAEDFAHQGQLAISADRLFGYAQTETTLEADDSDVEATTKESGFNLLVNGGESLFSTARVGFDYFIVDNVSIGGALGYANVSNEVEIDAGQFSTDGEAESSGFVLAPRVGYAAMFTDRVGLWPRGGITYVHIVNENDANEEATTNITAFTVEVPVVLLPAPGFAFTVGPTLDIGLAGGFDNEATDAEGDVSVTAFGVQAGILGYF